MYITRTQFINDLSKQSGFYKTNVKSFLQAFDAVIMNYYSMVTSEEEINIPITAGVQIGGKIIPPRVRKNPKDMSDIEIGETIKPFAKFGEGFRDTIQKNYEENKNDEG